MEEGLCLSDWSHPGGAYEIINILEIVANTRLLSHLENLGTIREKKKGQLHKVFKDSFDAKAIYSQQFLMQKINYIHNNPVSGKYPSDPVIRAGMLANISLNMNIAVHRFMKYN